MLGLKTQDFLNNSKTKVNKISSVYKQKDLLCNKEFWPMLQHLWATPLLPRKLSQLKKTGLNKYVKMFYNKCIPYCTINIETRILALAATFCLSIIAVRLSILMRRGRTLTKFLATGWIRNAFN